MMTAGQTAAVKDALAAALGNFIEIEAIADDDSDLTREHRLVEKLTSLLAIDADRIVCFSYSDALAGSGCV